MELISISVGDKFLVLIPTTSCVINPTDPELEGGVGKISNFPLQILFLSLASESHEN